VKWLAPGSHSGIRSGGAAAQGHRILADLRRYLHYGVTNAQPDTAMKLPPSLAQLQQDHVVMELECIDRMYLNAYIPKLTNEAGVAAFFRGYLGHRFASTKAAAPMTDAFITAIRDFIHERDIPLVRFKKGQRKDEVFKARLRSFKPREGVVFVGVAQEKNRVPRTVRKHFGQGGAIPWIDYTTALVNVYYFYSVDQDFGPFFITPKTARPVTVMSFPFFRPSSL
jgi:hypothetical protein